MPQLNELIGKQQSNFHSAKTFECMFLFFNFFFKFPIWHVNINKLLGGALPVANNIDIWNKGAFLGGQNSRQINISELSSVEQTSLELITSEDTSLLYFCY